MNNQEDLDYISRRDDFVRTMRKQNFLMEIGFYSENKIKGKRGRKPAPSKRIANIDKSNPRNHYLRTTSWQDNIL
jgi:hypothetical protein